MRIDKYNFVLYAFLTFFWVSCASGFVIDEFAPFLDSQKGNLAMLCEMGVFLLGIVTLRKPSDIFYLVTFLVIAFISTCVVNSNGIFRYVLGLRDFAGIFCVVPIFRWLINHGPEGDFLRRFNRQLYVWLVLQAVCIVWQFIRYGAGDWGGGTAGYKASGNASTCIYVVSLFLLMQNWDADNFMASLKANAKYLLLLLPTYLNETKVSFIYLAVYLFVLLPFNRKLMLRVMVFVPSLIAVMVAVWSLYSTNVLYKADDIFSSEFYNNYFYGDDMDRILEKSMMLRDGEIEADDIVYFGDSDVPRIAKYMLLWPKLEDIRGGVAFGAGISQFQGWNSENYTKFAYPNRYLLYGTKPWGFWLLAQVGLIGLFFVCYVIVNNICPRANGSKKIQKLSLFLLVVFLGSLLYNDCWRSLWFDIIVFYVAVYMRQPQARAWLHADS